MRRRRNFSKGAVSPLLQHIFNTSLTSEVKLHYTTSDKELWKRGIINFSSFPQYVQYRNLITGDKILWKRGEIAPKSRFSSFPIYFQYISYLGVKLPTYMYLWNGAVRFIFFLNSANIILRGMDISQYFKESLRVNESRLYSDTSEYIDIWASGWQNLQEDQCNQQRSACVSTQYGKASNLSLFE